MKEIWADIQMFKTHTHTQTDTYTQTHTLTQLYGNAKILCGTHSYSLDVLTSSKPKDVDYYFKSPLKECYSGVTDSNFSVLVLIVCLYSLCMHACVHVYSFVCKN